MRTVTSTVGAPPSRAARHTLQTCCCSAAPQRPAGVVSKLLQSGSLQQLARSARAAQAAWAPYQHGWPTAAPASHSPPPKPSPSATPQQPGPAPLRCAAACLHSTIMGEAWHGGSSSAPCTGPPAGLHACRACLGDTRATGRGRQWTGGPAAARLAAPCGPPLRSGMRAARRGAVRVDKQFSAWVVIAVNANSTPMCRLSWC